MHSPSYAEAGSGLAMRPKMIPEHVLLQAYGQGMFPMAHEGAIEWFSPLLRGLIPLDERFHIPHGLRRALKRGVFEIRINTAFEEVLRGCATREETWIDATIHTSYTALHSSGHAHSVECWDDDGLQGGLYGVELPGVFFGESMFSRKTDASKIALVVLVHHLRERGFHLLDTQWMTPHLRQFGGFETPRTSYLRQLHSALSMGSLRFSASRSSADAL
jgi:leucyl/phenylalanyl-tRNA---protein transferase